jgi:uncharacterized protein (TIGR03435 family)
MQSILEKTGDDTLWRQLAPHLEAAMSRLSERDRTLLALRFYENKTGSEAAALLGIREEAAHKRTARALEKLRKFFTKRGVSSTTAIITGAISANSVQVAPAALAKAVTAIAAAKGVAAGGSTLILAKGALKMMAWAKAKTAIAAMVVILTAGTATTVVVRETSKPRITEAMWQLSLENLTNLPPVLVLRQSKFTPHDAGSWQHYGGRYIGRYITFHTVLEQAYGNFPRTRVRFVNTPPNDLFDLMLTLPDHPKAALAKAVEKQFGWTAHKEMIATDVLRLQPGKAGVLGLQPGKGKGLGSSAQSDDTTISLFNSDMADLESYLEQVLELPVVDGTGLPDTYNLKFTWKPSATDEQKNSALKRALLDQSGLELVPTNMPIEMLVVEKVK